MIITDRFIFIHMPKTGGTFVTEALTRLHELRVPRRLARVRRFASSLLPGVFIRPRPLPPRYGRLLNVEPKHGTCHDIPDAYRGLPLVSCMRNPYDWYVSQYEFAWWKRAFEYHPEPHPTPVGAAIERVLPEFERDHPEFPEVDFEAFVELCDQAAIKHPSGTGSELGLLTLGFVQYFYKDPDCILPGIDNDFLRSRRHEQEILEVEFLRTQHLNEDLHDFLIANGYASEDVAFVRKLGRILPMGRGRGEDQPWEGYYTPELKAHIRSREWLLFELFPEFDV